MAVAHSILIAVWHILHDAVPYQELGAFHFDRLNTQRLTRYYLRRLEELGVKVTVQPIDLSERFLATGFRRPRAWPTGGSCSSGNT